MKEKNALSTRCRLFCSDTAGSIQSPKKREIAPHVRTISLHKNAKVVSFRTIRLRVEKRGDSIFWIFFKARPAAVNDFRRRRFFFSRGVCVSLEGKRKSTSLLLSGCCPEKSTKTRAVSRKKSNSWFRSTPASYLLRLHRKKKKKKKKKSHQR